MTEKFPLEKILTVTAGDYVKSVGKDLQSYSLVGVHSNESQLDFTKKVPENAEAVVDFFLTPRATASYTSYFCGTALIPKSYGKPI